MSPRLTPVVAIVASGGLARRLRVLRRAVGPARRDLVRGAVAGRALQSFGRSAVVRHRLRHLAANG